MINIIIGSRVTIRLLELLLSLLLLLLLKGKGQGG